MNALLTSAQVLERAKATGPETWSEMPSNFPQQMHSIIGKIGEDNWLVVEHELVEGQLSKSGHVGLGYDGTLAILPGHIYRLDRTTAQVAYLRGRAWLDKQPKKT